MQRCSRVNASARKKRVITVLVLIPFFLLIGWAVRIRWLHEAAEHNRIIQVKFLLLTGANPNAWDLSRGDPPLFKAIDGGHLEMTRLLLDHGANVNEMGCDVTSPVYRAVMSGNPAIVSLLLERGADLTRQCSDGDTPLEAAQYHVRIAPTNSAESERYKQIVEVIQRHLTKR